MSAARPLSVPELLVLRAGLLFVDEPAGQREAWEEHQELGILLELANLGYVASERLRLRLRRASAETLMQLRDLMLAASEKATGGNRKLTPMFRRFPEDVPDDTLTLWWDRVIVCFLQEPHQPCVLCCRGGTTHVLETCMHVVCERCFDGSNYSGCPICNRAVNKDSPFFKPAPERPGSMVSSQTFKLLDLGNPSEDRTMAVASRELFTTLCLRPQVMSPTDVDTLLLLATAYGDEVLGWTPALIPVRENRAMLFGTLLRNALLAGADAKGVAKRPPRRDVSKLLAAAKAHLTTATDVLRLIAVYSGAPVALLAEQRVVTLEAAAAAKRFGKRAATKGKQAFAIAQHRFRVAPMPRAMRRELLGVLDGIEAANLLEDLERHDSRWVWVAEHLHPGEYAARFPNVARVFHVLRNGSEEKYTRPQPAPKAAAARRAEKPLTAKQLRRAEKNERAQQQADRLAERVRGGGGGSAESLPMRMVRTLLDTFGRGPVPAPHADGPGPQTVAEAAAEKAAAEKAAAEKAAAEKAAAEKAAKREGDAAGDAAAAPASGAAAMSAAAVSSSAPSGTPPTWTPLRTWPAAVEAAIATRSTGEALRLLSQRPGEFLRRFDLVLRRAAKPDDVIESFAAVVPRTATPALVALRSHIAARGAPLAARVFWPKANFCVPTPPTDVRPTLPAAAIARITRLLDEELLRRFAEKPAFATALLDAPLADIIVPFNERTASRSAVQLPRGSSVVIPDAKELRLFMHWCEPAGGGWDNTTDLDLSVGFFDATWNLVGTCAYYQLTAKDQHGQPLAKSSGDYTSAPYPDGAAEFVDFDRARARAAGYRYAVMVVNAYSGLPFSALDRATAGVMLVDDPKAGAHFDPRTVALAFALAGQSGVFMPLVVDLETSRLHWLDAYARGEFAFNNVATSKRSIGRICPAMLSYFASGTRPSMLDLGRTHAAARSRRVLLRTANADGSHAATHVFLRRDDETPLAFLDRLRGGAPDQRLAPDELQLDPAHLGEAPVFAMLLRGDLRLPEGSASYALFRQQLIPTLAAPDLLA